MRLPLALSLLTAIGFAAEAQVATPFEVRKEAQELFDDLDRRTPGAEDAALLERVQQLMARSGDRLIEPPGQKGTSLPLAEVLAARLTDLGLAKRFTETYAPLAERRLPTGRAAETELLALARSYPATPAAKASWERLADRAWDEGRIGSYLQRAGLAGEAEAAAGRGRRLTEAHRLLAVPPAAPPVSLDGIEEMWRQPLDLRSTPSKASTRQPRPDNRGPVARIAISRSLGDLICGSDGSRAFVIDHLVGREQGTPASVGNTALLRRQCMPAVLRDGFAVTGVQDVQRLVVVALDREGGVRWRASSPGLGFNPLISAPVAIDRVVAVAMVVADDDAADLRVQAYDQDDGRMVWDVLVARLAGHRPWMFSGDQAFALIPGLCAVDGRLLVLSNSGVIARIGADGDLQRVWTYRAPGGEVDDGMGNGQGTGRMGAIVSDGRLAVATPADLPGQALIIDGDRSPASYRGDGAGGDVLALADGRAFLAGSRLVAVDIAKRTALWDAAVPGTGAQNALNADLQAVVGNGSLLVAGREAVSAYDPATGKVRARRSLERPVGLGVGDQTLVIAADGEGTSYVAAYGGASSVVERLTTSAKADPTDVRSVVALASIATARDQVDQALGWYDEAFKRGAGPEYAVKAARLLRRRLDLAAGAEQWDQLLARFAGLAGRDPALATEVTYWRARRAESLKLAGEAAGLYRTVVEQAASGALISVRDDLSMHLAALAACGLRRLDGASPLPWMESRDEAPTTLAGAWQVAARRGRGLLVGGGLAVGYADGVLTANRVDTGAEVWWRKPQRPLLGVRSRPEPAVDGVPIDIMPGTSAAAAGLLPEDVLQRFNGQEMRSFTADLVPAVLALTVRSPFTAQVRRGSETITLNGTLGGEMVEPVIANERTVLVWPTMIGSTPAIAAAAPGTRPEGLWVAVHDLATGAELWRHAVPPATQDELPARPLLTPDDLVVLADGGDLVALPAHPPAGTKDLQPVWRLSGQSDLLRNAKVIGRNLLWLADQGRDESLLVEAATGRPWARLPIDATQEPLLLGADLYARTEDGTLTAWDLGLGRKRWTIPNIARLAAAAGDTLWVVNVTGQLIALDRFAGSVRRLYGEWTGVVDSRVSGERLYLHATPTATTHSLACISLSGGAVLWQQNLPGDLAAMEPLADGVGCLLAGSRVEGQAVQPPVALAFSSFGDLLHLAALTDDVASAQVRFLAGGLLIAEASGLRADPAAIPPTPPALPAGVPGNADQLTWQQAGSARYALALRPDQTCEAWIDVAGDEVLVRLGQLGHVIDLDGLLVRLPAEAAGAPTVPAQVSAERVPGAAAGSQRWKVIFPPVLGWKVGIPLQVRVDSGSGTAGAASDCPPTPWWLRTCWRTVVPPGGTPGAVVPGVPTQRDGR